MSKLRRWEPRSVYLVAGRVEEDKMNIEESAFISIKSDPKNASWILLEYENWKSKLSKYPPKSENVYNLFLKFYKSAKKDLKEKGKISKETLKIIQDAKSE